MLMWNEFRHETLESSRVDDAKWRRLAIPASIAESRKPHHRPDHPDINEQTPEYLPSLTLGFLIYIYISQFTFFFWNWLVHYILEPFSKLRTYGDHTISALHYRRIIKKENFPIPPNPSRLSFHSSLQPRESDAGQPNRGTEPATSTTPHKARGYYLASEELPMTFA